MPNRWVIVFAAAIVTTVGFGSRGVFSVFYVEMLREFSWDRADLAGVYSLGMLIMGVGGTLAGALADRLGPRRFYLLSGLFVGLMFFLASCVETLLHVYLTWGVMGGLSMAALGIAPAQSLVTRWFENRRGLAIGLVGAGTGGGNLLLAPLAQIFIESIGWRDALVVVGLVSFLVVAVFGSIYMREPPSVLEKRPSPEFSKSSLNLDKRTMHSPVEWTLKTALRTSPIWTISVAWLCLATSIHFIGTHFVALAQGVGHPPLLGAGILAISGGASIISRIVAGGLSDRIGRVKTFVAGAILAATGMAVLFFHRSPDNVWELYLFSLLFGGGIGAMTGLTTSLGSDMYRGKNFGAILGFLTLGFGIGGAVSPWLAGWVFESMQSYRVVLCYEFFVLILSAIFFSIAGKSIRKYKENAKRFY